MKNKRSKSSVFYDSTKNKRRKQEQSHNLQTFNQKNFPNSEKFTTFSRKRQNNCEKSNNTYRAQPSASVTPFLIDETDPLKRSDYTYQKGNAEKTYRYEFTNSKFIHFLGTLDPKSYLVFVTLIGLLLANDLNTTETKIIYAFISNIADTMLTLVEQEVILQNFRHQRDTRDLGNALHHDLEAIYAELAKIKKKLPN